jgi:hypothetical protein
VNTLPRPEREYIYRKLPEYSTVFVGSGPIVCVLHEIQAFWEELTALHYYLGRKPRTVKIIINIKLNIKLLYLFVIKHCFTV